MQHFFVEPSNIHENRIMITGEDVNHIKNVLRMRVGEEISVSNGVDDKEYRCIIESIDDSQVVCNLVFIKENGVELRNKIILFQGLPKADKMEMIIQKAVELGAYEIVPVATKRAVVKLDEKKAKSKLARWQSISEAAAKQSQRALVPEIKNVMTMKEAVEYAKGLSLCAIPYELCEGMDSAKTFIEGSINAKTVGIFIGPEGGFAEEEIKAAKEAGIIPISLGRRILRTETAGLAIISMLMYQMEINNTQ